MRKRALRRWKLLPTVLPAPAGCAAAEKLDGVAHRLQDGVPIVEGALSWVVCELRELIAGGDHTITSAASAMTPISRRTIATTTAR